MKSDKPIYVTQPFMPPLNEFLPYLEQIWDSKWLTNSGPFHEKLESVLAEYLGVEYLSLFANGTIALITALQALRITGEVITTPYSFVATTHALLWNDIEPVFVDIDPETFNLDSGRIEEAITPLTTAIMPIHCYGNPCAVNHIQQIAETYGLKVIYDAAHAFGIDYKGESLLKHGDLSVLSFHATKVYNTFEGGAIICPDAMTKQRIDYLKNFGFAGEDTVIAAGINGKMSEIHAAFGILQLDYIEEVVSRRREIDTLYRELLADVAGISCGAPVPETSCNYSYYPIFVEADYPLNRDALYQKLRRQNVSARRYFYPLITRYPMYRRLSSADAENLPVANAVSSRVICLPIHPNLSDEQVEKIAALIKAAGA